ncbi:MAG: membrane dipeptidase [Phycisphaerae bacterium]|nr:membrane dipeptidase [Phycisphaerae bacterium]NIR68041.1 membrane dipeptidase [candidate division Zixibacteria bacterium]NIP56187.1 membrane dipeptidase [Phycisphaerae bacterium]NIS54648.1 membrane dipeptidase [Phycisphaerae bacterium]NIU11838.1 membrane dipeptidase [Phycisphaerae bacterium]
MKQVVAYRTLIDTHIDVPYRVKKKGQDISRRTKDGDFDFPRAKQGGLGAAFMVVYVPAKYELKGGARVFADETIDMIEGWANKWPDKFILAGSPEDLRVQFGQETVSIVIAMENGSPLEGNLANIKHFYDRGVRYITLVHSKCNHICDSSFDPDRKWNGLSPFGREVVAEMNRIGMMIDVSHASDETFYQILEVSKAPVVATHSACRHFTPDWERNMSDEMIRLLADKGGTIQITFGSGFVNRKANIRSVERKRRILEHLKTVDLNPDEQEVYTDQYIRANPLPQADISDVVQNIDHAVNLVGINHVGLGSDFDGLWGELPAGLKDVSCYPNLINELLKSGYTEGDIKKICTENILRLWSAILETAVS